MQISREYDFPTIEITECGCCYMDTPYEKEGGRVPDDRRTQFFRGVLAELARAIKDGAKVRAFHAWSLMDNFEWTDGYSQRYGLTYVDYRDQKRTVKDSGLVVRASRRSKSTDLGRKAFAAACILREWPVHRSRLERETMANEANMNIPDRPEPTPADERVKPVSNENEKERVEREADKLAHKGIESEQDFDDLQKPFTI